MLRLPFVVRIVPLLTYQTYCEQCSMCLCGEREGEIACWCKKFMNVGRTPKWVVRVVRKSKHCFFVGYSLIVDIIITLSRDRQLSQLYCVALQQFAQVVISPQPVGFWPLGSLCQVFVMPSRKRCMGIGIHNIVWCEWWWGVGGDFACHDRRFTLFDVKGSQKSRFA